MTKETIIENTCEVTIIPQLDVAAVESIYSSLSVKLQSITITPKFEESFLEKALSFGGGFALAAGVLGTIVEMFSNLMSTNEEFGAAVDEVWTQITEAMKKPFLFRKGSVFYSYSLGTLFETAHKSS